MRTRLHVGGLALLAATSLALRPAAIAQAPSTGVANAAPTGISAELLNGIDTKRAKTGDQINARITIDVRLPDGTELARGSRLTGNIVAVTPSSRQQLSSHLVLVLNRATTKEGRTLPIHAMLTSVTAPLVPVSRPLIPSSGAASEIGHPLVPIAVLRSAEDKVPVGNLPGVLLSAPNTPDSAGVLDAANQNILLATGTSLTLNISPADDQRQQ